MTEVLALLQNIAPIVAPTILKPMSRVIYGLLISKGRITMWELSGWTAAGGSYRTLQRWYHSKVVWLQIMWLGFTSQLWKVDPEYIAGGEEVVFGKAGKAQPVKAGKRARGRPKGSKNKEAEPASLSPELLRIQPVVQAFWRSNIWGWMVLPSGLQFVSKLGHDAAL